MTIQDAINKMQNQEYVFLIYNKNSMVPYVCCDTEDTMLDYASCYYDEEAASARAKEISEMGISVLVMKIKKELVAAALADTVYYGIDAVRFFDGKDNIIVETNNMVRIDPEAKDSKGHPYLMNPSAQISMIYLVQELGKKDDLLKADKENFMRIQNEVLSNIANSDFYIVFTKLDANTKIEDEPAEAANKERFVPAILKDKKGNLLLPIFTDMNELKKAFRGEKDKTIPYKAFKYRTIINTMLGQGANIQGVVINPAGVRLPLLKNAARILVSDKRFIQPGDTSAEEAAKKANEILANEKAANEAKAAAANAAANNEAAGSTADSEKSDAE